MNMMEHKPAGGESGAKKDEFIPFFKPPTYEEKIETQRKLEAEIKADRELEKTLKVAPKGLNAPTAQKMLLDTIERLAKNQKEYDKLMGVTVQ